MQRRVETMTVNEGVMGIVAASSTTWGQAGLTWCDGGQVDFQAFSCRSECRRMNSQQQRTRIVDYWKELPVVDIATRNKDVLAIDIFICDGKFRSVPPSRSILALDNNLVERMYWEALAKATQLQDLNLRDNNLSAVPVAHFDFTWTERKGFGFDYAVSYGMKETDSNLDNQITIYAASIT